MASNRDQFTTEIYVNNEQAQDAIDKLIKKLEAQEAAYKKLQGSLGDFDKKTLKAKKDMEATRQSIAGVRQGTENYRRAIENLSGQSMSQLVKMQKQLKRELDMTKPDTAEWKNLAEEYRHVTERMKSLSDAQRGVTTWMGRLGAGAGGLMGKLGNLGSMITAVPALLKGVRLGLKAVTAMVRETISASQTLSDKWENAMTTMKTATNAFFIALSTGNWDAFNGGLSEAVKNAREYAAAVDQLGSRRISHEYVKSEYLTNFREDMVTVNDDTQGEEARRAALESARKNLNEYLGSIEKLGADTKDTLIKKFRALYGIDYTGDDIGFEKFFDELYRHVIVGENNVTKKIQSRFEQLQSEELKGLLKASGGGQGFQNINTQRIAYDQAKKQLEAEFSEMELNLWKAAEITDEVLNENLTAYGDYKNAIRETVRYQRQLNTETESFGKKIESDREKAGKAAVEARKKAAAEAYNASMRMIEKTAFAERQRYAYLYMQGKADKKEYDAQMLAIEDNYLAAKLEANRRYGKETESLAQTMLNNQLKRYEEAKKTIEQLLEDERKGMDRYLAAENAEFGSVGGASDGKRNPDDQKAYDSFQEAIWAKAADIRAAMSIDSARQEYETNVAWAKKLAEQEKITAEEAQEYILKMKLDYAGKVAQKIGEINEAASGVVNAIRNAELAAAEANHQALLAAAGDNAEKREEIESKHNQKKLEIQKKYADADMAINIAKAIANGSVAALRAIADLGPIAGVIMAGVIAATTAAEVASIVAQRNVIKNTSIAGSGSAGNVGVRSVTGYSEGGYTGAAASDNQAVGVVHANEWVAPAWMVRENRLYFANLERYRKSRTHGGNDSGYAKGGYAESRETPWFRRVSITEGSCRMIGDCVVEGLERSGVSMIALHEKLNDTGNQIDRFKKQTTR